MTAFTIIITASEENQEVLDNAATSRFCFLLWSLYSYCHYYSTTTTTTTALKLLLLLLTTAAAAATIATTNTNDIPNNCRSCF